MCTPRYHLAVLAGFHAVPSFLCCCFLFPQHYFSRIISTATSEIHIFPAPKSHVKVSASFVSAPLRL